MNKEELEEKNRIFNLECSIRSDSRKVTSIKDLKQMLFYYNLPNTVKDRIDNINDFFLNLGIEIYLGFQMDIYHHGKWPRVTGYFITGETKGEKTHYYLINGRSNLTKFTANIGDYNSNVSSFTHSSIEDAMAEAMEFWQRKIK